MDEIIINNCNECPSFRVRESSLKNAPTKDKLPIFLDCEGSLNIETSYDLLSEHVSHSKNITVIYGEFDIDNDIINIPKFCKYLQKKLVP